MRDEELNSFRVAGHRSLVTLFLVMACAGCAGNYVVSEGNYQTYEHPFTDAAAADVRKRAERHCAEKKRIAVRTSSTCSLTQCTTSYQCMGKADATGYQQ